MNSRDKYNNFWKWFANNSELIFNFEKDQENIFDLLLEELHKIDKYLTFEFGTVKDNKREFILSADGMIDSFSEVENLYNQKPELENWIITKFRPRKVGDFDIKMNDISLSAKDIFINCMKMIQKLAS